MSIYTEKERERLVAELQQNRILTKVMEVVNLICNSVRYEGADVDGIDPDYITQRLIYDGEIGYVNAEQAAALGVERDWYRILPMGRLNKRGYPAIYQLSYPNNARPIKSRVSYESICPIKANSTIFPLFRKIAHECEIIDQLETSMIVNVQASRNTDIIPVDDFSTKSIIEDFYRNSRTGAPAIVIPRNAADKIRDKIENKTPFVADRIDALRVERWNDLLKRAGVMTPNEYKRERVQTAEVNAGVGEAIDYLYTMIDTFNADCERLGVDARMIANGYIDRYDEDTADSTEQLPAEEEESDGS